MGTPKLGKTQDPISTENQAPATATLSRVIPIQMGAKPWGISSNSQPGYRILAEVGKLTLWTWLGITARTVGNAVI